MGDVTSQCNDLKLVERCSFRQKKGFSLKNINEFMMCKKPRLANLLVTEKQISPNTIDNKGLELD